MALISGTYSTEDDETARQRRRGELNVLKIFLPQPIIFTSASTFWKGWRVGGNNFSGISEPDACILLEDRVFGSRTLLFRPKYNRDTIKSEP